MCPFVPILSCVRHFGHNVYGIFSSVLFCLLQTERIQILHWYQDLTVLRQLSTTFAWLCQINTLQYLQCSWRKSTYRFWNSIYTFQHFNNYRTIPNVMYVLKEPWYLRYFSHHVLLVFLLIYWYIHAYLLMNGEWLNGTVLQDLHIFTCYQGSHRNVFTLLFAEMYSRQFICCSWSNT